MLLMSTIFLINASPDVVSRQSEGQDKEFAFIQYLFKITGQANISFCLMIILLFCFALQLLEKQA